MQAKMYYLERFEWKFLALNGFTPFLLAWQRWILHAQRGEKVIWKFTQIYNAGFPITLKLIE